MKISAPPLVSALLTAICVPQLAFSAPPAPRLLYTCDNDSRIELSFSRDAAGRPQASIHFADGDVTLPQVPTASGALYRAGDARLHTQGEQALFEDNHGNVRFCRLGEPAPSRFIDITGSVSYLVRRALPPDAVLHIRVQDAGRATPATLAEQTIELKGQQVPVRFEISIDRDFAKPGARIQLTARITSQGRVLFTNDTTYPAIQNDKPLAVDMRLRPFFPSASTAPAPRAPH